MPSKGRPRLSLADLEARIADYCRRYHAVRAPTGLPSFPTGKRETPQHREWMKLYKAHQRLSRRQNGTCERCGDVVSAGSVFCESHRPQSSGRSGAHGATASDRRALLEAQGGMCPICGESVELSDSLDHSPKTRKHRALVHQACNQLVDAAESLGPKAVERVRDYLWPVVPKGRRVKG